MNDVKKINLVFCTDDNYVIPTGTVIRSIVDTTEGFFNVYIITEGLAEESHEILSKALCNKGLLNIIKIKEEDFKDCPIREGDHVSRAAYYRIMLPGLLPMDVERCLYLDGDMLVLKNLEELYNMEFNGASCIVCHDERNDDESNFTRLGLEPFNGYFNSGFLLINLTYWRENKVQEECFNYIKNNSEACLWHDQDALNKVLNGKVLYVNMKYNLTQGYLFNKKDLKINESFYKEIDEARKDPYILHFSSNYKPWHVECNSPYKKLYRDYYKEWRGCKLHLKHRNKGKTALIWHIKKILHTLGFKKYIDFRVMEDRCDLIMETL